MPLRFNRCFIPSCMEQSLCMLLVKQVRLSVDNRIYTMLYHLSIRQEGKGHRGKTSKTLENPSLILLSQVVSAMPVPLLRQILAVSTKEQPQTDHFKRGPYAPSCKQSCWNMIKLLEYDQVQAVTKHCLTEFVRSNRWPWYKVSSLAKLPLLKLLKSEWVFFIFLFYHSYSPCDASTVRIYKLLISSNHPYHQKIVFWK